ncbi:cuticle protein CP14.6-like [Cimex lectularius]|uniref:CPR type cuticle protein n=1 Tax=Cimex lectularius TaxID=79782 RepID=A0A8I6RII6_CIMLE|nr:cuticle protein CP14.6-like [Cimex lectularius]
MNTIIAIALLTVSATAQFEQAYPQLFVVNVQPSQLISRTEVRDDAGQFALSYRTADGTVVNEQGLLKSVGAGNQVLVKQGSFAFLTPEGIPVQLKYIADENGFQLV